MGLTRGAILTAALAWAAAATAGAAPGRGADKPAPGDARFDPSQAPEGDPNLGFGQHSPRGGKKSEIPLAEARRDFAGVVRAHVAKNSRDGVWVLREGVPQPLSLKLVTVDQKSVRKSLGAPSEYVGAADFRDVDAKKTVRVEFIVDLAGSLWSVKSASLRR